MFVGQVSRITPAILVSLGATGLPLAACSSIFGIDALPPLVASDAGSDGAGSDDIGNDDAANAGSDSGAGGGGESIDLDWAAWPVPPDRPASGAFTSSGNVVTDGVTGLSWQKSASPRDVFADAKAYCAASRDGGFSDWRVPRWIELFTLLDFGKSVPPAIDTATFPGTSDNLWSLSDAYSPAVRIAIQMLDGKLTYVSPNDQQSAVRCVRGDPAAGANDTGPDHRYVLLGGIARDKKTGLQWQQALSSSTLNPTQAAAYCAGLSLGSLKSGWRVPTIKELVTLLDTKIKTVPRWHQPTFGTGTVSKLWSSTRSAADAREVWDVDFGNAQTTTDDENVYAFFTRCVHD